MTSLLLAFACTCDGVAKITTLVWLRHKFFFVEVPSHQGLKMCIKRLIALATGLKWIRTGMIGPLTNLYYNYAMMNCQKWTPHTCHILMTHTSRTCFNTLASGCFRGLSGKKAPKRTWFCAGNISDPGRSVKRHGKSSSLHSQKNFLLRGCGFFVSDVISGGLSGHLKVI